MMMMMQRFSYVATSQDYLFSASRALNNVRNKSSYIYFGLGLTNVIMASFYMDRESLRNNYIRPIYC